MTGPKTGQAAGPTPGWALCHVFVFVDDLAGAAAGMAARGLVESYRRAHPGQGTANVCYCFDDAFLELLAVTDPVEIGSPAIAPTGLADRARWRDTGACPIGIAIRPADGSAGGPPPFPAWDWRPPYLPEGLAIPVAEASRDPALPFVFRSPGSAAPVDWTDGRAGDRQRAAGLARLDAVTLAGPEAVAAGFAAVGLSGVIGPAGPVRIGADGPWGLDLVLGRTGGGPGRSLRLVPGTGVSG